MKTVITLYIHQHPGEPQVARTVDMSDYANICGVMIGTVDVEVEWQEIRKDPTAALIEYYEREIDRENAQHRSRVDGLLERIHDLRLIEHKKADQ